MRTLFIDQRKELFLAKKNQTDYNTTVITNEHFLKVGK